MHQIIPCPLPLLPNRLRDGLPRAPYRSSGVALACIWLSGPVFLARCARCKFWANAVPLDMHHVHTPYLLLPTGIES